MTAPAKKLDLFLFWAPAMFVDDHIDRAPCDGDPEREIVSIVRRTGSRVMVIGDHVAVGNLRSDAAFYCHRDGPDACPRGLKQSAAAVLRAIPAEEAA